HQQAGLPLQAAVQPGSAEAQDVLGRLPGPGIAEDAARPHAAHAATSSRPRHEGNGDSHGCGAAGSPTCPGSDGGNAGGNAGGSADGGNSGGNAGGSADGGNAGGNAGGAADGAGGSADGAGGSGTAAAHSGVEA